MAPKSTKAKLSMLARTGRRMDRSEIFMAIALTRTSSLRRTPAQDSDCDGPLPPKLQPTHTRVERRASESTSEARPVRSTNRRTARRCVSATWLTRLASWAKCSAGGSAAVGAGLRELFWYLEKSYDATPRSATILRAISLVGSSAAREKSVDEGSAHEDNHEVDQHADQEG